MLNVIVIFPLVLLILSLGKRILKSFNIQEELSYLELLLLSFGFGAGFLALGILVIGLTGLLYKWPVLIVLILLFILLRREAKECITDSIFWLRRALSGSFSTFERILLMFIALVWGISLAGALSPILGMDALSYHMRDPKLFIRAHKIMTIPYTRDSVWPFLIQMLFTLGILLKGFILGKLFNFVFGIFSILSIYVLCRRYWPRLNSITAAAIFATIPAIFTSSMYAYTDLAVIFYTLLAFLTFLFWDKSRDNKWFYISAIFCGFLLGIKITSATVPALILVFYLFNALLAKNKLKDIFIISLSYMGLVVLTCGIWYIRSWIIYGNPIYPFASYLFSGFGYPEDILRYHTTSGIGIGVLQYIKMLWPLTMDPNKFGGESIGAVFLIFLPLLVFLKKPTRFIRYLLFVVFALYTSWFIVYQYTRFLYPALAFMSILVAYLYFEVCAQDKFLKKLTALAILLLLSYGAALSFYHNFDKIPVALGFESNKDFLSKHERTYRMAEFVNNNLPQDAKILTINEVRLFYFDREIAVANSVKIDIACNRNLKYDGSFEQYIIDKGFRYLLYVTDNFDSGKIYKQMRLDDIFIGKKKSLIKEVDFDYRGEKYNYKLYKVDIKNG